MYNFDRQAIDRRLYRRISTGELTAIGLLILAALVLAILRPRPYDFQNYLNIGQGDYSHYYYAYWFVPVFRLLAWLPFRLSYFLWNVINIFALFFGVRIFGGKVLFVMLVFQSFFVVIYGQITGLVIGALALVLWSFIHQRPYLAGLGLLIAFTKYQLGVPAGLAIWILFGGSLGNRLRALLIPAIVSLISLIVYPGWPSRVMETIQQFPPNDWGSISFWRWLGPFALLFWLPPILLPLIGEDRFIALMAALPMAMPYFQQTDLLLLFSMPTGWLVLLGNFGALYKPLGWNIMQALALIPLLAYMWALWPGLKSILRSDRPQPIPDAVESEVK